MISLVLRRFLILSQPRIVFLFCTIGLTFAFFTLFGRNDLPSLADHLGDFGETEVLALETFSHTYERLADAAKKDPGTHGLRISHMPTEDAPVHSHRPVDGQRFLQQARNVHRMCQHGISTHLGMSAIFSFRPCACGRVCACSSSVCGGRLSLFPFVLRCRFVAPVQCLDARGSSECEW